MSAIHACTDGSEFETSSDLCYRKVTLNKTSPVVIPHTHSFAHDMIVVRGTVFAKLNDVESMLSSGDVLTVPADAVHSVRLCPCAEQAAFFCTWPKRGAYVDSTRGIAE